MVEADTKPASSLSNGIDNVPQDFYFNTFLTHTKKQNNSTKSNKEINLLNNSSFNPLIPGIVPCSPNRDYHSKKAL